MIRLSTKGRYGARLMLDLAANYFGKKPILLKDISKRQDISIKYLEQIVMPLRAAGLVTSVRGAKGGYVLAMEPKKNTLGEIVRVLEGPLAAVECVHKPSVCKRVKKCVMRDIWGELSKRISNTLDNITLQDLVSMEGKKKLS